jgi:hypothetical protein
MPEVAGGATVGIGGSTVRGGLDVKMTAGLLAALALVVWAGYQLAGRMTDNADLNAPPRQPQDERDDGAASALARLNPLDGSDRHAQVCETRHHYQGYVYLPCRYPRTVGGELTNTIHHGYSMMRVPMASDISQWIANPPSEVAWL